MSQTDRTGLYIMVFLAMMYGCNVDDRTRDIKKKVNGLEQKMEDAKPTLREEKGQKFYEINGQRAYIEVDGRIPMYYSTNFHKLNQLEVK